MMFDRKKPWVRFYVPPCQPTIPKPQANNMVELFERLFQQNPSANAFVQVMPNGLQASLNYGEIEALSDEFALYLREVLGFETGDRVGIQLPNCLTYPVAVLGTWKAGGTVVNLNPLSTGHEMSQTFRDAPLKVLVVLNMFADKLRIALEGDEDKDSQQLVKTIIVVDIATFFRPVAKGLVRAALRLKRLLPTPSETWTNYESISDQIKHVDSQKQALLKGYLEGVDKESLAVLQYTGGTTGISKGVRLSHANLIANIMQIDQYAKANLQENSEVVLTALPLYHIFAFTVNFLLFLYNGATNVLVPSPRPIKNLKKAMDKHGITWMTGVNTLFQALLGSSWFSQRHVAKLRAAVAGGMALQTTTASEWKKQFNVEIVEGYGLSEASPVVAFNPIGGQVKMGTIGIPLPSTEVRCVDANGKPVKPGEVGELIVKGPQVMEGYWNNPSETELVLRKGWLHTGDMAQIDAEGYVRLVDRKKDVIIVSGFNVYPSEVEACILKLKNVEEVGVVGQQDERSGEVVKAVVVAKGDLTKNQVEQHCKEYLSAYKVPKVVEFRESLPKTPIGKVSRKDLK